MRENRTCGSEGGEAQSLPYPYPVSPLLLFPLSFPFPLASRRLQVGDRAPTMACCQHGESPCGGYTLTPKSNNLSRLRGGVGSKLR